MTKNTPHSIFIAESTRRSLKSPVEDLVFVDELEVRGKRSRVPLWTLAQRPEGAAKIDAIRPQVVRRA
jgi:class 3 adenylate cyclase